MIKYYLNLTNGIEFLDRQPNNDYQYSFIRIQSTACEQKRWDFILQDLDYDFLMHLALGTHCVVVDYSAHKKVPRSLYQGIEWVKFVLNKVWLNKKYTPFVKQFNTTEYFEKMYKTLNKATLKKLKYFKYFLNTDKINLSTIPGHTSHDGQKQFFKNILLNYMNNRVE
jgi:hypothetical protein